MYRSRLLRWAGIALATFTLLGVSTYLAFHNAQSPVQIVEEPKWNGGG